MRTHLLTLATCFILALGTCAQARSLSAQREKDKDVDTTHARKSAKVKITHGPVVENGAKPTYATIAWSTNVKASTILKYGTSPNNLNQTAEARWGGVTHRVELGHLKPGTTYYYRVESTQAQGTGSQALSGVEHFRTPETAAASAKASPKAAAVKVTHGPVIEAETPTTATVAWSTNVNASTILKYGTNSDHLTQTAEARWGGLTHRVYLRGLKPATVYYYRVESTQAQGTGTQAVGPVQQFRTRATAVAAAHPSPAPKTAPQAAAHPAVAPEAAPHAAALHNLHQFLATHPNINRDLQKDPNLARNGRYLAQHAAFRDFLQTHPIVRQHLAQAPKPFLASAEMAR